MFHRQRNAIASHFSVEFINRGMARLLQDPIEFSICSTGRTLRQVQDETVARAGQVITARPDLIGVACTVVNARKLL